MATEIIASGTVGPTGGRIADEFEEVVVTVPEGAVEEQTLIEILRAVDENFAALRSKKAFQQASHIEKAQLSATASNIAGAG